MPSAANLVAERHLGRLARVDAQLRCPAAAAPSRPTCPSPGGAEVRGRVGDGQAMVTERPAGVRRARRHLLVAGFVLAYLAAGGVTLALGDGWPAGAGWRCIWCCWVRPPTPSSSGASISRPRCCIPPHPVRGWRRAGRWP